jgi:membrane-associated phospholipid phosphatase
MHDETKIKESPEQAPARPGARLLDLTFYIGPDLIAVLVFAAVLAALMIGYGAKFTFVQSSIIMPLVWLAGLIVFALAVRIRGIASGDPAKRREFLRLAFEMIRDWFPLVLIVFIYENLHEFTDQIRPDVVDGTLRRADEAIFGVEPTLFLQKISVPWFTEFMTVAYALYFGYPALIVGMSYARGEFYHFREMGLALTLCVYIGFLGYVTVPAIGPRYYMADEFTVPLSGIWLTERAAAAWNAIEKVKRDCFPSLHTGISAVGLVYLWRFRRQWRGGRVLFWSVLPLCVSLWFSTVYLRYHWTVDVFAGWALAVFCCWSSPRFIKWYYRRKTGTAPLVSTDLD